MWADLLQFLQNPSQLERLDDRVDHGHPGHSRSRPLIDRLSRRRGRSSSESRAGPAARRIVVSNGASYGHCFARAGSEPLAGSLTLALAEHHRRDRAHDEDQRQVRERVVEQHCGRMG